MSTERYQFMVNIDLEWSCDMQIIFWPSLDFMKVASQVT